MKRFWWVGFIIFILCVSILFFYHAYPNQAYVVEVIDGDTVRLNNGNSLRYLGINTPEVRLHNGNDWEETGSYWGNMALKVNAKLVLHKKVRIKYDKKRKDRFRRLLGYVFVDGGMVNAEILRRGLAVIDVRWKNRIW